MGVSKLARQTILVVDDDQKTVATIQLYLEREGFQVITAFDGKEAIKQQGHQKPDLIILDLMLPEVTGLEVCRQLRTHTDVPIIMLTARTTENDKLRGLNLGADDYVAKPFSPRELVARVRTILRRVQPREERGPKVLQVGDVVLDFNQHEVRIRGRVICLTPAEFKLLAALVRAPNRVFTRQELVDRAFGYGYEGLDRTVDAHIMNLRRKVDDNGSPSLIRTVYGVGYKFSLTHPRKTGPVKC